MKIAIVGAHGVGKTTLANELSRALNYPIVIDSAREAVLKGFAMNEDTTPENQLWNLCKQIEYERALKDNFIADKALFDNIVYSRQIFDDPHLLKVIEDIVKKIAHYDVFIYLPIEISLVDDKVRSPDPHFQRRINEEYLRLMKELQISYHEVRGSVKERLKKSLKIVSSHK